MARVVVLGAGVAGHTAALLLREQLPREHEVVVVSPKPVYNWVPSNIWVGVGMMRPDQVTFELAPVYRRKRITFHQARAVDSGPRAAQLNRPLTSSSSPPANIPANDRSCL